MLWRASEHFKIDAPWYGKPRTGTSDEVVAVFLGFDAKGFSHLQVRIFPSNLAGVEAFAPVLEALDRND